MFHSELQHRVSSEVARRWWVFLVSGIAWLLIAVVLLRLSLIHISEPTRPY